MLLTAGTHVANVDEGLIRARCSLQGAFVIVRHSIGSANFFRPRRFFHLHTIVNLYLIAITDAT